MPSYAILAASWKAISNIRKYVSWKSGYGGMPVKTRSASDSIWRLWTPNRVLVWCSGGKEQLRWMMVLMSSLISKRHEGLVVVSVTKSRLSYLRAIEREPNAEDIDPEININLFTHLILPPLNLPHPNHGYWKEDEWRAESIQAIRCLGLHCCSDRRWDRHWP